MRTYYLKLEEEVVKFYTKDYTTIRGTRRAFRRVGELATQKVIDSILPYLPAVEAGLKGILIGGIARAGTGVCAPSVVKLWERRFPGKPVLVWCIGASRPEHPDRGPASIYWVGNFETFPNRDYSNWILISYEFGMATASTVEGVFPVWRRNLPGLRDGNIVFIAACACLEQSQERMDQVSKDAILAYGSAWRYTLKEGQRFYLRWMERNGQYQEFEPRDWGSCCFGKGSTQFINFLRKMMCLTATDYRAIRTHFTRGEATGHL